MTHLSLEQCQQLKELGFPQEARFVYREGELIEINSIRDIIDAIVTPYVACPTLEELLVWVDNKALENLFEVRLEHDVIGDSRWDARICSPDSTVWQGYGATPLEATYHLAISLYGK